MVMIATMMGWKKDDEEDRAFWKQMRANQISVLNEDTSLFGSIQRAYEQGELHGIMLGSQEQHIYWYNEDRKSVVKGKSVSVRVDIGGRWILKKKIKTTI